MTADRLAGELRPGDVIATHRAPRSTAILSLCDRLLGEAGRRGHMFGWLRAPGSATEEWLVVDSYYPAKRLVVVCSPPGPHDELFDELIPQHGLRLLRFDPAELGPDPERALSSMIETMGPPPQPVRMPPRTVAAVQKAAKPSAPSESAVPASHPPVKPEAITAGSAAVLHHSEAFGIVLGLSLVAMLGVELYVGSVVLALGSGLPVLAFGIALDACSRGLGTIAAERAGEHEWAWGCLLGGSPVVAAFTLLSRSGPVSVEPAPLAGLVSLAALAVLAIAGFAQLMAL
jgi:hypothetical protein